MSELLMRAAERAAAEEADRRRERERQRERRMERVRQEEQSARRVVRRSLEQAEAEVAALEAQVAELTAQLADPALYATEDGARRSTELATELQAVRHSLDNALERWAAAMKACETQGAERGVRGA